MFSLPASVLTNQSTDIKTLCGKDGEILEEKMMLAFSNKQRVALASDFLSERIKNGNCNNKPFFLAIRQITNCCPPVSVKSLADSCFLSVRQFERGFKEFSGFSPKLFLRICRFNSVIKEVSHNKSLTQIAYRYGYYDQSHFIHEFQKFSGYRPGEYFQQKGMSVDYRATTELKS